jgi:hypothetical protein
MTSTKEAMLLIKREAVNHRRGRGRERRSGLSVALGHPAGAMPNLVIPGIEAMAAATRAP